MDDNRLNKKLVIERALPKQKKKPKIGLILFIIILLGIIAFCTLEYLGYINYVDFI